MSDFATWTDLEAFKRNLQFTKDELLKKQEQAVHNDEKLKARDDMPPNWSACRYFPKISASGSRPRSWRRRRRTLARSQERLMDSLEKLQSGDKNLDSIMKQISELAKTLAALQQAVSQLAQQMPDDFMNTESMQGLGFNEMFSALDEIRKKLMPGDIEGARQLARELFNQMASMVASLQNAQRSAMASSMGRMQGEMQRSANELQEIAREQQEILGNRRGQQVGAERAGHRAQEKLDRFLEKAMNELGQLTELFPDREGPDDPNLLTNLDDATMNRCSRISSPSSPTKIFPATARGTAGAKELGKKRTPAQERRAQRAEKSLDDIKSELHALLDEPAQALNDADKRTCAI